MNWYVLFTLSQKIKRIVSNLNRSKELEAFIPVYEEVCNRDTLELQTKNMFDNYIFVKTTLNQGDFNDLLIDMKDDNDGLIKQLKNVDTSALSDDEITFFNNILDHNFIARISHGYKVNGRTVVIDGPLVHYQDHIIRVNTHNSTAYLDLTFFDRKIKLGIVMTCKE